MKAVDFLEKLIAFYKVASFEMNNFLIRKIISTTKPLIISTGMASLTKFQKFIGKLKIMGQKHLYFMLNYPSKISDFNLNNIKIMKNLIAK